MNRREVSAVLAASAIAEVSTSQARESEARYTHETALPKPNVAGKVSLEEAIQRRRSVRAFRPGTRFLPRL